MCSSQLARSLTAKPTCSGAPEPFLIQRRQRAVAVADELRRFGLLDDLLAGVDVCNQVDDAVVARRDLAAGAPHVQAEMIADHLRSREMSLRRPLLGRFLPEDLKQADAVHRLMFQDAGKSFLAG